VICKTAWPIPWVCTTGSPLWSQELQWDPPNPFACPYAGLASLLGPRHLIRMGPKGPGTLFGLHLIRSARLVVVSRSHGSPRRPHRCNC